MRNDDLKSFMDDFYSISNKMNQIRNTPVTFKGNICVNSAGLFFLEVVGKNQGVKMSEIGAILGLTKGAVSQMAAKLEKKELIKKIRSKDNAKDIYLELTQEGLRINKEQQGLRAVMYEGISGIVSDYSEQDIAVIRRFLFQISAYMEKYQKNLLEFGGSPGENR